MAKKGSIRGNQDGNHGGNDSYTIIGRGTVSRQTLLKEVKSEKHEGFSVVKLNDKEYVKSTPDATSKNNINR